MENKRSIESARCPMERLLIPPSHSAWPRLRRVEECGWKQSLVRIAFGNCEAVENHSSVTVAEAQAAVLRAIESWNAITLHVKYFPETEVSPANSADIVVQWLFSGADTESILNAETHAHADYPAPNTLFGTSPLPLHFNADLLWGIEQPGCYDIETVALHELAHLLGLIYHSGPDTILYDAIGPAPFFVQHRLGASVFPALFDT